MKRKIPANPKLPKLGAKLEARLAAADDKSALGYEALEDATGLVAEVAREIRSERITLELRPVTESEEDGETS